MTERLAYIVSDRTGITAETLAHSLLTQFPTIRFRTVTIPFVDTNDKARDAVGQIDGHAARLGSPPLVFTTIVDDDVRATLNRAQAVVFDLFDTFIVPLEKELGVASAHKIGKTHGVGDRAQYTSRISAVNFSVRTDDGLHTSDYEQATVIMLGVSRSGKTPTCLYLALQYGIYAANYPLTEDDLAIGRLPDRIAPFRDRLFGLTIEPGRLQQIRSERRANSRYSQLKQCQQEVAQAEALFRHERIPNVDVTAMSIEEIGSTILHRAKLRRGTYEN